MRIVIFIECVRSTSLISDDDELEARLRIVRCSYSVRQILDQAWTVELQSALRAELRAQWPPASKEPNHGTRDGGEKHYEHPDGPSCRTQ
jgi:hypothetical protein